jgi:MarR family transcriptional regulator, organic hydroperoxide resistance regulator
MSTDPPRDALKNYTTRAGGAALGARLRRLSERIDREIAQVYAEHGERVEQRWFGALDLLDRFGPLTGGELAGALGITHVSISQTRDSLDRAGLVSSEPDAADGRRRILKLTDAGQALVGRLRPLWDALSDSARDLDAEAGGVVAALDRLERALDRASVIERARTSVAAREKP